MEEIIENIRSLAKSYRPNEEQRSKIAQKTLVMVVGPSAVGKDYVIDQLTARSNDHAKVRTFTTRAPREGDEYENIELISNNLDNLKLILRELENGELINIAPHPTSPIISGTRLSSYPGTINYLPTLYSAVAPLTKTGFERVEVMGILAEPHEWIERLLKRHTTRTDRIQRITEAQQCLEWLLANMHTVSFIYNQENEKQSIRITGPSEIKQLLKEMSAQPELTLKTT